MKVCITCQKSKEETEFYINDLKSNRLSSYCKLCDNKRTIKWSRNNKAKKRQADLLYMNKEENYIRQAIYRIFKPSAINPKPFKNYHRKGWRPEITKEEVYAEWILHIQLMKDKHPNSDGKLCRYCDVPLTFKRTGSQKKVFTNFSVDRFNSLETYKKGNIMFCCSRCNTLKNGSTKAMWVRLLEIDKELRE